MTSVVRGMRLEGVACVAGYVDDVVIMMDGGTRDAEEQHTTPTQKTTKPPQQLTPWKIDEGVEGEKALKKSSTTSGRPLDGVACGNAGD